MRVTFTLNQLEAYALSMSRLDEFVATISADPLAERRVDFTIGSARDYFVDTLPWVSTTVEGRVYTSVWVGSREFDTAILDHAFCVYELMKLLKEELRVAKNGGLASSSLPKARKMLVDLLDSIEW